MTGDQGRPRVAVIGGGFTGLTAAYRLLGAGCAVTVMEAGPELGGLAASFRIGGEPLEKAYHHFFRTDDDVLSLIDELGIAEYLEWLDSSLAIHRDGRTWPFMTPLDLIRFKPVSLIGRIRLGLAVLRIKHRKEWQAMEGTPALDWMRRHCGESATNAVWDPLLRGKFSSHADKVSMAWLWARLHVRSNSRGAGGGKEQLGYLRGGFVRLVDALEEKLRERGAAILTSCRVDAISGSGEGVEIDHGGGSHRYDAAIFTGSNRVLANVIRQEAQVVQTFAEGLAGIDYLGAICLVFLTDQKLGDYYWTNVSEDGAPFVVMIRHTALVPAARYGGKEVYYLGAYVPQDGRRFNSSDEELEREWFGYVARMHPAFDRSRVEAMHWFRFKDAQHVVDCDYAAKIPPRETPVNGLFLANFSQVFPEDRGTNFAVRDGNAVARMVLAWLDGKAAGHGL